MIRPVRVERFEKLAVSLEGFADDKPFERAQAPAAERAEDMIDGLEVAPLAANRDARGWLTELSIFDQAREPIVHVYQVTAAPGSVRAWVYHKRQTDRLAYTEGAFEVVLFDARPQSPTYRVLNVFRLGAQNPALLRIPPFVVHGVRNLGKDAASFINMPTRRYDPAHPDKSRLAKDDPRIPYRFDER